MKNPLTILFASALLLASAPSYADYFESFDGGSADWHVYTVSNRGLVRPRAVTYVETDGQRDGFLSMSAGAGHYHPYCMGAVLGPTYGDLTGLTLTVDFKLSGVIDGPVDTPMVRAYVGSYENGRYNYFVSNDAVSWDPNDDLQWTRHEIALVASNFLEWPNRATHGKTFDEVIANPTDMGLVFAGGRGPLPSNRTLGLSSTHGAILSVDNFGTICQDVPEPGTLALLGLGGAGMVFRRQRRHPSA